MTPRLWAAGATLSACVATWVLQGDQTKRIPSHLALYGLAFAVYLLALQSASLSRRGLRLCLGLALVWRIALVLAPPLLSDDVYRYVWEGRIQLHGGNPYAWRDRPAAPQWTALRDDVWDKVNHKDYTAVYPPLWQMAARAVTAMHGSVIGMKLFVVCCEALTLAVLARLLALRRLPAARLLVLAWSPLALVEIAGSGHNEALGILFVALAMLGLETGRPLLSALAAVMGLQVKLLPGLLAAAWARRYRAWHAALALGVAALLVVPYAGARSGLWRSLGAYAEYWRFNETLFAALAALFGARLATLIGAAALAGLALFLAWRRAEPVAAAVAVTCAWLLLAPNVLPWYALWLLPLLVLQDAPGALLFTGTIALAYLVYPAWLDGGPWSIGWPMRALEYLPCIGLALAGMARSRQARALSVAGCPS
jgi:alpha-1,6-mannosyltransferase